jgi:hypothetical protein
VELKADLTEAMEKRFSDTPNVEDGRGSRASDVAREMREAGYRRLESLELLPIQIFEVFGSAPQQAAQEGTRRNDDDAQRH